MNWFLQMYLWKKIALTSVDSYVQMSIIYWADGILHYPFKVYLSCDKNFKFEDRNLSSVTWSALRHERSLAFFSTFITDRLKKETRVSWQLGAPIVSGYSTVTFTRPVRSGVIRVGSGDRCLCKATTATEISVQDRTMDPDETRS